MFLTDREKAMVEDVLESETVAELKALWCMPCDGGQPYAESPASVLAIKAVLPTIRATCRVRKIEQEIAALATSEPSQPQEVNMGRKILRGGKRYKLLKEDVSWTGKDQVHVLMQILMANFKIGEPIDEADIVAAVEANVGPGKVLQTVQGGKRIWDYYKGDTFDGLQAHGNIERC